MTTLMVSTSYLHNKLTPVVYWMRDWTGKANMYMLRLIYDQNDNWHYTLGSMIFTGEKNDTSFDVFTHKNLIFFKTTYKWG